MAKRLIILLVLYVAIVAVFWRSSYVGDEHRYVRYAQNLVAGHYAEDGLRIWNGPGYPLALTPFVWLGIPMRCAVLLNVLFLLGSVMLVRQTAKGFMTERGASALAFAMGLYAPFFPEMASLLTEPLAILLVCAFMYCMVRALRRRALPFAVAAGVCLGCLALTKILYGYVITAGLMVSALLSLRLRSARPVAVSCAVALACCAPYLAYTWSVTGRAFYWGNSGGLSMYWMSTPNATEYGDWTSPGDVKHDAAFSAHKELFSRIESLDFVERDDVLRRQAIANIAGHPGKALFNWLMNVSRLWFCYPNTNKLQRPHTLGYMVFNSFLLAVLLACVYPLWHNRRHLPPEIWVLICFVGIALGGSSFLSAVPRMLNPVVPALFIVIGYTLGQLVEVRLRETGSEE